MGTFLILLLLGVIIYFVIREESQNIIRMNFNSSLTLFLVIFSAIVIIIWFGYILFLILDFLYPDPNYCDYCKSFKIQ